LPAEFLRRTRELVEQNHDEPGAMQVLKKHALVYPWSVSVLKIVPVEHL